LPEKFLADYDFMDQENKKSYKKTSQLYFNIGMSLLILGILISLITYIFSEKVYVIFYGLIIVGLIITIFGKLQK
jgi:membrane protein YdbS with pleckstrin-like domain